MVYEQLSSIIDGEVLLPECDAFEHARTAVWNLDSAGIPAVIVRCKNADDVSKSVVFAVENSIPICVHSAGAHSTHAVVDNCLVIDLSLLRTVTVNPTSRTVTVAAGATIGDVDAACKPHGLALPMGHVHHTGVAGMVLDATSGMGFLCRTRKLTVNYLRRVTLVLKTGKIIEVTESENEELFWGLKGAGANFGVAVEMEFSLTKIAPKIFGGDVIKFVKGMGPNVEETREDILTNFFIFFRNCKDECYCMLVLAPKGPVVLRVSYHPKEEDLGDTKSEAEMEAEGRLAFEPLLSYGKSLMEDTRMIDFWDGLQKLGVFEPSYYYQKGAVMTDIPPNDLPGVISKLCAAIEICPVENMSSGIIFLPLAGELSNLDPASSPTAQVLSKMKFWCMIITNFPEGPNDPDLREKCVHWVQDTFKVVEPYSSKDEGRSRDKTSEAYGNIYGSNVQRLRELKTKYDPSNVFSQNRNIAPL